MGGAKALNNRLSKRIRHRHIRFIGPAFSKRRGKGVFAHKGSGGADNKPMILQQVPQFNKGVVKVSIAKKDKRNPGSAAALYQIEVF
jgi:hypothetical protein